jgi:hypothetical protein
MLTLFGLLAVSGVTNDANWVSFGGAGAFVPHKSIQMLEEDITVAISDDSIHVRVLFSFENKGEATTVEMAFPFEDTYQAVGQSVLRFATKVDGVPTAVRKLTVPPLTREGRDWKRQGYDLARPFVYVKTVDFDALQRRTVLVDYVTNHGFAGTGWRMNEYILHTGATWAGKIRQCRITVDWSEIKHISQPALKFYTLAGKEVAQEWTMLSSRKATATLTDFEPDCDLDLSSIESFWNVTMNGKPLPLHRGHSGGSGPILSGSWADPLIYGYGLPTLFDEGEGDDQDYIEGVVANAFGNFLEIEDESTLRDGLGRRLKLRRKVQNPADYEATLPLQALIEALGGKFKWVAEWERLDITLPTRQTPLRKKGDPVPPERRQQSVS